LREPFSDLANPGPHDRVVGSIVVELSAENLDPDGALFKRGITVLPAQRLLHEISEKRLALLASLKGIAAQNLIELFVDPE
jgi:hypothetical protein